MLKKILKSIALQFATIKYLAFAIQFINLIFIAKYLGVFYFGIYSFFILSSHYLNYSNFGIYFSLNTILSIKKSNKELSDKVWGSSLTITHLITVFLLTLHIFFIFFEIDFLNKYYFNTYSPYIFIIAILFNYNILYSNLFRVYSKFRAINFYEIIGPLVILISIITFNNELTVLILVYSILIKHILSLVFFILNSPKKNYINTDLKIAKIMIYRGLNLLFFNLSLVFILTLSRTLVSIFYSVEDLANFSLAHSLSLNVIMLVGVFSFIFYPKLLNKLSLINNPSEHQNFINKIQKLYVPVVNFVAFFAVIFLPVIIYFIPKFYNVIDLFRILIVAQVMINMSFGYSVFLVSAGKELVLTIIGFISLLFLLVTGFLLASSYFSLKLFMLSIILTGLIYSVSVIYYVKQKVFFQKVINIVELSPKNLVPQTIIIFSAFINSYYIFDYLALLLFIILNFKTLKNIFFKSYSILLNNNSVNF